MENGVEADVVVVVELVGCCFYILTLVPQVVVCQQKQMKCKSL